MSQSVWRRDDLVNLLAAAELTVLQAGEYNAISPEFKAGYLTALATVARSLGFETRSQSCEVVETRRPLLAEGRRP